MYLSIDQFSETSNDFILFLGMFYNTQFLQHPLFLGTVDGGFFPQSYRSHSSVSRPTHHITKIFKFLDSFRGETNLTSAWNSTVFLYVRGDGFCFPLIKSMFLLVGTTMVVLSSLR
eukprot:TRINITY_DN634_c0_g1_i1.p1 TRINITY_DN634_c0_g1~~TRINITY_DN634_c0_g1_i1.p1  ORF type:complete len:116 (+),score=8.63 TRINITY_DN634_c0_g1_i1:434-781(+)